jgi:hypothetical protein
VRQALEDAWMSIKGSSFGLAARVAFERTQALAQRAELRSVAAFFSQDALSSIGNKPL